MSDTKINPHKAAVVSSLREHFAQSKSVAVFDYRGLKVNQANELRRSIKSAGGSYVVAKNTLFKIASGVADLDIQGISGFVFSKSDEVSAIKAVANFAKKNAGPTLKMGLMGDRVLSLAEITELASLPDRATQATKLVMALNSPLFKLAYHLNWTIGKLVRTLDAVAKSKGVN